MVDPGRRLRILHVLTLHQIKHIGVGIGSGGSKAYWGMKVITLSLSPLFVVQFLTLSTSWCLWEVFIVTF